jgi:hypothetical protein
LALVVFFPQIAILVVKVSVALDCQSSAFTIEDHKVDEEPGAWHLRVYAKALGHQIIENVLFELALALLALIGTSEAVL